MGARWSNNKISSVLALGFAAFILALTTPAAAQTITTIGSGFNEPTGVAVDSAGNVYVADASNNAVKRIAAAGGAITTLGSGFNYPTGVAVDSAGNIYVADTDNNAVKKLSFTPVTPVPTLSGWSMIVLGLLLAGFAMTQIRQSRSTEA